MWGWFLPFSLSRRAHAAKPQKNKAQAKEDNKNKGKNERHMFVTLQIFFECNGGYRVCLLGKFAKRMA